LNNTQKKDESFNCSVSSSEWEQKRSLNSSISSLDENKEFDPKKDDIYEPYRENVFESNEENILDDAVYVYDYINKVLGIEEKNIIIFGRSMGSGPATHVASVRKPGCLLLMSSFKSIRAIAQDQAGKVLKYLI
jgi:hypothetical protein